MDFAAARRNMVESQIRTNRVTDARIVAALGEIPRELFVGEDRAGIAYVDEALNLASLVPLFSKLPRVFTDKFLREFYRKPCNKWIQRIGIVTTLLLANRWFLRYNFFNLSHMLVKIFFRPKFLYAATPPKKSALVQAAVDC